MRAFDPRCCTIWAPGSVCPEVLGLTDDDALALADDDGLGEALGLFETLGLTDEDGEIDADGDGLRLTLALGLLIISRTANVTIALSSEVPLDPPTGLLPCPAVVSINVQAQVAPISISGPAVLFAPAVGGV